jgi:uncharacterized protein (TIGR02001 family)
MAKMKRQQNLVNEGFLVLWKCMFTRNCFRIFIVFCNTKIHITLLGALFFLNTPAAQAEGLSGIVSASTNYVYRGYSKSYDEPFGRVNVDYEHQSGFYLGAWISRINFGDTEFNDRSNVEFYPYIGFNYKLAEDWRLDSSVARYIYDAHLFGKNSDYNEYSVSLHFRDLITTRIAVADDAYHQGKTVLDYEVSGRYPVLKNVQISTGLGYNNLDPDIASDSPGSADSYTNHKEKYYTLYWNVGLTWFVKNYALDIRYVDAAHSATSHAAYGDELPLIINNFVFSVSASF